MYSNKQSLVSTTSKIGCTVLLASIFVAVSSCIPKYNDDGLYGKSRQGGSKLSSIDFKPIPTDALVTSDGKKPVTDLHLRLVSSGSSCTQINEIIAIKSQLSISKKITRGCDYSLTLELGPADSQDSSATKLKEIYYSNPSPMNFTADKDSIPVTVNLTLTETGKQLGLPESLASQDQPIDPQRPETPTDPSLTELPAKLKVSLTGELGPKNLSEIFTTKYLVVDFSRLGCSFCVSMAASFEAGGSRSDFVKRTSGKDCKFLTVLPPGQVNEWNQTIGGGPNSHSVQHSYEFSGGHAGFARLIKYNESMATPTFVIIDRSGQVVSESEGDIPSDIGNYCKF